MRLLALTKYGPMAASTRQRFIQYRPALAAANISVTFAPLFDDAYVRRIAQGRHASPISVLMAYARRLINLMRAGQFDALWIQYELFPYFPGVFERLAFLHNKPVIYDFDDAIFHIYDASRLSVVRRLLGRKLARLMRGSALVCCGNDYLREYAGRYSTNLKVLPTVVDIDRYVPRREVSGRSLTIGWIGSPSTWIFVRPFLPLIRQLCRDPKVRFLVVGAGPAADGDCFEGMINQSWSEENEIRSVQEMDIGIMPLPDDPWARGKCGYKLIQYMACGLPVVASPVGVNSKIVVHGVTGLLASSEVEWRDALTRLIEDPALRRSMGEAGRMRAVKEFSLQTHAPRLVQAMRSAIRS